MNNCYISNAVGYCVAVVVAMGLLTSLAAPISASADPLGGFVTQTMLCTCTGNFRIKITEPTRGWYSWYPGTPQFSYFQLPRTGIWILGTYSDSGTCKIFTGNDCTSFPVEGTINMVGSSL